MLDLSDFHDLIGFEIIAVSAVEKSGGDMLKLDNGDVYELELLDGDSIMEMDDVAVCRRSSEPPQYKLVTEDGIKDAVLLRTARR
jgi:hypothetical protein